MNRISRKEANLKRIRRIRWIFKFLLGIR